jgi:hypothetical protein
MTMMMNYCCTTNECGRAALIMTRPVPAGGGVAAAQFFLHVDVVMIARCCHNNTLLESVSDF